MARGSERARRGRAQQIANGNHARAKDLSLAGMSTAQAWRMQAEYELALGLRCHGCGRRVGIGARFVSIDVKDAERPAVYRTACSREDCDFAGLARDGATAVEMIEHVWLDELGVEGPSFGLGATPHEEPAGGDAESSA